MWYSYEKCGGADLFTATACPMLDTRAACIEPCTWEAGVCLDPTTAAKVRAGDRCPCIENNMVPRVMHQGEQRIVYTDPDGAQHFYPDSYGTQQCWANDRTLPPD